MAGYKPVKISDFETGLIQDSVDFTLPDDAFTTLENAYVWRKKVVRKRGNQFLSRPKRVITGLALPGGIPATGVPFNIFSSLALQGNSPDIKPGTLSIVIADAPPITFTDDGLGVLTGDVGGNSGTVNYASGEVILTHTAPASTATTVTLEYFPCLPIMGIRTRERPSINEEEAIVFDTSFSYLLATGESLELPSTTPTTWAGSDSDFFWTTNFWVNPSNQKLFWATNFVNSAGNAMRYYDGITWTNFLPKIDSGATINLAQARVLLPFRGRMIAFNTFEGTALGTATQYPQRIRWAAIGNPIETDAWRDDLRGKGAYIDIPTSESIVSAGFVRDNIVVFCERSTWQLRYTGNVIQPFQIEKVNTELGAESTFSAVQFDTSLVGIGDKGIVECDSFSSKRIDDKIPDFAYRIQNTNNGLKRVHGIRDFTKRLAFWNYPDDLSKKFPNKRLVLNYENASWGIFTDSVTSMGYYQPLISRTWQTVSTWSQANFKWRDFEAFVPQITGGNQRGFLFYLDEKTTNDAFLTIQNITGNDPSITSIECTDHNLANGSIIQISDIPTASPFAATLNGKKFKIGYTDKDNFTIFKFSNETKEFSAAQIDAAGAYIGGGRVAVVDNFAIVTKKFNFLDQGEQIQIGYIDTLFNTTSGGLVTLKLLEDYNPITLNLPVGDAFFNFNIPTSSLDPSDGSTKTIHRSFAGVRGSFLTAAFTLSPEQMNGTEQAQDVQLSLLILWVRPAGSELFTGAI